MAVGQTTVGLLLLLPLYSAATGAVVVRVVVVPHEGVVAAPRLPCAAIAVLRLHQLLACAPGRRPLAGWLEHHHHNIAGQPSMPLRLFWKNEEKKTRRRFMLLSVFFEFCCVSRSFIGGPRRGYRAPPQQVLFPSLARPLLWCGNCRRNDHGVREEKEEEGEKQE
jgi:hypothetical protein